MRHHGNDIGIAQQVAGDTAKQALPGAGVGETTDYQEFGADIGAGREHFLANVTAAAS
jgi:hypothetical protein